MTTLLVEKVSPLILKVTLNRPAVRNAINLEMMHALLKLWQDLAVEQTYRCIILTGAETAFCAGADLKARSQLTMSEWQAQHAVLQQAMLAMLACPIPIIAAVNGAAFGGGLELALASDFAYAADTAIFSQSEVKIGIMPGALGTQNLPRAVGLRRAKELTFTAATFSAQQAYEWGLINKLCDPVLLMTEVQTTAEKISEMAPLAIKQVKQSLNQSQHLSLQAGYEFEVAAYNQLLSTEDRAEGIRAFNEKRKPHFTGR